jgi:aspartate/methionine/tyrosine aminotransferase
LQKHFKQKRDHVLARLHEMHLDVDVAPTSTFYLWLNLETLPPSLNTGLVCHPLTRTGYDMYVDIEELLKERTFVIPGIVFDINPAHRRNLFHSPCRHFVRLSFGLPLQDLDKGS